MYPSFHPCLPAHHVHKFGDIIPTGPIVIHPNTLNLTQNFEFWLPPHHFLGDTHIFRLTFEAPPIARHLAKFHGDRSRELGDLGLNGEKAVALPPKFWAATPPILVPALSKFTHFQSCLKVSPRSAEGSRRYNAAKCHKQTNKKHQQ